jgi:uncharacterized membrane protein
MLVPLPIGLWIFSLVSDLIHGAGGNAAWATVALYLVNFWLRSAKAENPGGLVWLSVLAIALLVVSGWLGGKLVYEGGVAVTPGHD